MDPFTIGIGLAGLGLQAFGTMQGTSTAKEAAGVSANIAGLEGQVESQRKKMMELTAHRDMIELSRRTQRARAQAESNAVSQGAQYGSGLQGGLAQITSQGAYNQLGLNQNLAIGRNIFGLNAQISQDRVRMAQLKGEEASASGLRNLGGSLTGSAGTLGNIFGALPGFFGSQQMTGQNWVNAGQGIGPYAAS